MNNNDFIEMFEKRLCEYTGAPYAVAVDRCTNAILLSLEYLKVPKDVPLEIPTNTYISVPMTLKNYGYSISLYAQCWILKYRIGNTPVYDCAVGFKKDMYVPGEIQCLSFQQKKRLAIGKGGAILTDNEEMAKTLKRMRHDGRDSSIPLSKENPDDVIMGYHMNMSPEEASKGLLLLNQLSEINPVYGSCFDYPNLTQFRCLK